MITPELLTYIVSQRKRGVTDDAIHTVLMNSGWKQIDINDAFREADKPQPLTRRADTEGSSNQSVPVSPRSNLYNPIQLLGLTLSRYRSHFFPLVVVMLVWVAALRLSGYVLSSSVFSETILSSFNAFISSLGGIAAISVLIGIVLLIVQSWVMLAVLQIVVSGGEVIGPLDALRRAWSQTLSLIWLTVLYFLIVLGGTVGLVIPGIILLITLLFAPFVLFEEKETGFSALVRSKNYMRKSWVAASVRLLFLAIFVSIFTLTLGLLFQISSIWIPDSLYVALYEVEQVGVFIFIVPFTFIYLYLLYRNMKAVSAAGDNRFLLDTGTMRLRAISLVGIFAVVVLFAVSYISVSRTSDNASEISDNEVIENIKGSLEEYYSVHTSYPASLAPLEEFDDSNKEGWDRFSYYTQSQGKSYSLCRLGKNECYSPDLVTPTLVPTQQPTPAVAETVTPTNVPESTPTPTSVPVGSDLQLIKEAIESYRSASNGLPNTLSDLVPTYLNESIALSQFSYIVDTENQQYLLCDTRDGQGFICIDSRIPESS